MRAFFLLSICPCVLGCGSADLKNQPTIPVELEVYYQGKPAQKARVILHPTEEKDTEVWRAIRPHGVVREDGKAALTSYFTGDGAPAGEYVVTVSWPAKATRREDDDEGDLLNGKFLDPSQSQLRVAITSAGANPSRIDLR